jgi:GTP cyclohydrolase II
MTGNLLQPHPHPRSEFLDRDPTIVPTRLIWIGRDDIHLLVDRAKKFPVLLGQGVIVQIVDKWVIEPLIQLR